MPVADLTACRAPITGGVLRVEVAERLARVLKALAEPTRLRLVSLIAAHQGPEACVCELTEPVCLSQPTVSHHIKVLVDAGLMERGRLGKWAYYRCRIRREQLRAASLAALERALPPKGG